MLRYSKAGAVMMFRGTPFSETDVSERRLSNVINGPLAMWWGARMVTDSFSRRGNNAGNIAKWL